MTVLEQVWLDAIYDTNNDPFEQLHAAETKPMSYKKHCLLRLVHHLRFNDHFQINFG